MRGRPLVIAAGVLLATMAPAAGPASEAWDFRILAGASAPNDAPPLEYMRFYPETLHVHRGDTVLFEALGFHTTAFWPGGDEARPTGFRPDENPSGLAIHEPVFEASPCGRGEQAACVVDDLSEVVSSGAVIWGPGWRATIDLPAGTTVTYICLVRPGMTGTIEVVDDGDPLLTQDQIDDVVAQQIDEDTQEAIDHKRFLDEQAPVREEDERNVWTVLAGADTPSGHASIIAYMPSTIPAAQPGDAVEFIMPTRNEGHSATFPTDAVGDKAVGPNSKLSSLVIYPACDVDDTRAGLPGVGFPWAPFTPAPCAGHFELLLAPWFSHQHRAPDDEVTTRATYHDSGLLTNLDQGLFPTTFWAEFPLSGEFTFACTLHGADYMAGSVTVR